MADVPSIAYNETVTETWLTLVATKINTLAAAVAAQSEPFKVGAIYATVDATNPATTLGYGTWVAFGAGRALVGVAAADPDFGTVEQTSGAKTVTLTTAEMPAHAHPGSTDPSYKLTTYIENGGGPSGGQNGLAAGAGYGFYANTSPVDPLGTVVPTAAGVIASQGGGGAHNNLQPSIAVYLWKRTA